MSKPKLRTRRITMLLTPEEYKTVSAVAGRVPLTVWMRDVLLRVAAAVRRPTNIKIG